MKKEEIAKMLESKTSELEGLTDEIKKDNDLMNEEIKGIGDSAGDMVKEALDIGGEKEVVVEEPKVEESEEEKKKLVQIQPVFLTGADKSRLVYETHLMVQEILKILRK